MFATYAPTERTLEEIFRGVPSEEVEREYEKIDAGTMEEMRAAEYYAVAYMRDHMLDDQNRFVNIVPYLDPAARVLLPAIAPAEPLAAYPLAGSVSLTEGPSAHDLQEYINASVVERGPAGEVRGIATQAPNPATRDNFWRMLLAYDAHVVVSFIIDELAVQVFPRPNAPVRFSAMPSSAGAAQLTVQCAEPFYGAQTREYSITGDGMRQPFAVTHIHLDWPDHGVPDLAQFLALVRSLADIGPVVVHCRGGIGRTGAFFAVRILFRRLAEIAAAQQQRTATLSVDGTVVELRRRRYNMVESSVNLAFVYRALSSEITRLFFPDMMALIAAAVPPSAPPPLAVGMHALLARPDLPRWPRCAVCDDVAEYVCEGCHCAYYCSARCRLAAWEQHRTHCGWQLDAFLSLSPKPL